MMKKTLLPQIIGATLFFLSLNTQVYAQVYYGNGVYTNLCGTGLSATADLCNRGCSTSGGYCSSAAGPYVVKFTCTGRQTECRSNESGFSSSKSLNGTPCNRTVQIDVFDKVCRVNGVWICREDNSDLQDYMVWYSGSCSSTQTPTPTPTPVVPEFSLVTGFFALISSVGLVKFLRRS